MTTIVDSASPLLAVSSSDLVAVTGGGWFGSDTPAAPPAPSSNVTPTLSCPAGTAPEYQRITGNLSGSVGTAGLGVNATGAGTFEKFSCRDLPSASPSPSPSTGGGD